MYFNSSRQSLPSPSSPQSLPVHIAVLYISLYQSFAWWMLTTSSWLCVFSTYLWLNISRHNCWVTERQYWPLHYRTARLTWHWPLASRSLTPDWPLTSGQVARGQSPSIYKDFIRVVFGAIQRGGLTLADCLYQVLIAVCLLRLWLH